MKAFNVSLQPVCDVEDLLPSAASGEPFFPPKSWLQPVEDAQAQSPEYTQPTGRVLVSGRPGPNRRDFDLRLKEIVVDNVDGYSAISRMHPDDKKPARLAHFRKFWEHLDNMAYYWDTSLDEYIPPKEEEESAEPAAKEASAGSTRAINVPLDSSSNSIDANADEPRKRAKTYIEPGRTSDGANPPGTTPPPFTPATLSVRTAPPPTNNTTHPATIAAGAASGSGTNNTTDTPAEAQIPGTYRGHRISNGSLMPHAHLADAVRYFLEPVAWIWGFSMTSHRRQPHLAVSKTLLPVRLSIASWRAANDRMLARQGYLEGPVLGVCCRPETEFPTGAEGERDAVIDLLRELGACLSLAQERAREGQVERRPGEGCWWTEKPRWGGGPGGEVGEGRGNIDELVTPKSDTGAGAANNSSSGSSSSSSSGSGSGGVVGDQASKEPKEEKRPVPGASRPKAAGKRRISAAEAWKTLRPGSGYWDAKVKYQAIGKDAGDEYDEVR